MENGDRDPSVSTMVPSEIKALETEVMGNPRGLSASTQPH